MNVLRYQHVNPLNICVITTFNLYTTIYNTMKTTTVTKYLIKHFTQSHWSIVIQNTKTVTDIKSIPVAVWISLKRHFEQARIRINAIDQGNTVHWAVFLLFKNQLTEHIRWLLPIAVDLPNSIPFDIFLFEFIWRCLINIQWLFNRVSSFLFFCSQCLLRSNIVSIHCLISVVLLFLKIIFSF